MFELEGKYGTAKVFTDEIEGSAKEQIIQLLNQDFVEGSKIRIMPDCHAGAGCVIGFTADLGDKVVPNLVGVDIGCGMLTVELPGVNFDLQELDRTIYGYIPSGVNVHDVGIAEFPKLKDLFCYNRLRAVDRIERSIGTLGGGNHFIEVDVDRQGNKYLVIHSGSRNLGKQVADYYQKVAINSCNNTCYDRKKVIEAYKKQGKKQEIQQALNIFKNMQPTRPNGLCFLNGEQRKEYLHDMEICQEYATLNRKVMANIILREMFSKGLLDFNHFHTVHNYIDFKDNIIRKGAISAYKDEKVLIPINMRDGAILATGKGNPDWNYSAPHGAGRIMSRNDAKKNISLKEFEESMDGIFSTSVSRDTIDESPMAYKSLNSITDNVSDTLDILRIIKPIYNFKTKDCFHMGV